MRVATLFLLMSLILGLVALGGAFERHAALLQFAFFCCVTVTVTLVVRHMSRTG